MSAFARRAFLVVGSTTLLAAVLTACASGTGSPSAPASSPAGLEGTVTAGKLTVATSEPAYFPYVIDDDPTTGQGFESAVAYAVAERLGYAESDVVWVRDDFEASIAPGPKDFDLNLQQVSITDEREQAVDFTPSYYSAPQAVITIAGSKAASATSLAELAPLSIGAAAATTSYQAIEDVIKPTTAPQAFNSNDDAILALKNGQVDAIVVDLPTAFYETGADLDDGVLIGQLAPAAGEEQDSWGIVLAKDSPLTEQVSAAVDALKADGTLDALASRWLGADAGAPLLK